VFLKKKTQVIVADTTPLRNLAQIDHLDLLPQLFSSRRVIPTYSP
jgi:predicted nucleic acid-binding protein